MITTVTLNASIDKAYYMEGKIENGTVMRVARVHNTAGGKGLNVARIIKLCGEKVLATGLVGGFNGQYLEALLNQDGISHDFLHVDGETRSCINILDSGYGSTEYLEPGFCVSQETEDVFLETLSSVVSDSRVVTISGSVPGGMAKDVYSRMVLKLKSMGKQVILDTSGELLKQGIGACPNMIKPNKEELEMLFGREIHSVRDVAELAWKLYEKGIGQVVVSLGKEGALLACEEGIFTARPPRLDPVNTVGCGDSMVGAFAVAMERKMGYKEALKFAVAVASAGAMSPDTGDFDMDVCQTLLKQVTVDEPEWNKADRNCKGEQYG